MAIVLIRACILYVVITFSLRLMGKHQLGELQPSELVVTILISNIAAIPVEDSSIPMIMGIIPILTLVCLDVVVSQIMLHSAKFRRLMIGSPRIIISEGEILQQEMKKLRYTVDDLMEAMREQQIFDISEVQYAIVETNGKIHFFQKKDYQNTVRKDFDMKDSTEDPQAVVIRDGVEDVEQLGILGLGQGWLMQQLRESNIAMRDVFLMTADKNGNHNIIRRQEALK